MSKLLAFRASHREELAVLAAQHALLVTVSTAVAIAVGVPLGIFAARRPRLAAPLVGIASIMQTVPSLATRIECATTPGAGNPSATDRPWHASSPARQDRP